jgi:hypothetical protein
VYKAFEIGGTCLDTFSKSADQSGDGLPGSALFDRFLKKIAFILKVLKSSLS